MDKTELYLKDGNHDIFRITITDYAEHMISFVVHEVIAWSKDNRPADFNNYLRGTIKWEGCSHIFIGEDLENTDGYLHLCGVQSWKNHCMVMEWIYKTVFSMIESADKSEEWKGDQ